MATSKFYRKLENSSLCVWAVQILPKQTGATGATSWGRQVAMYSQLPRLLVVIVIASAIVSVSVFSLSFSHFRMLYFPDKSHLFHVEHGRVDAIGCQVRLMLPERLYSSVVSFQNLSIKQNIPNSVKDIVKLYKVGCVAQLAERRSLTGELTLSCARPAADG